MISRGRVGGNNEESQPKSFKRDEGDWHPYPLVE